MLSSTNLRSASLTTVSGDATRVSVVPMHETGPIGITKKSRPSLAKKVSTRGLALSRLTVM